MKIKVKAIANAKKAAILIEKDENGENIYKIKIAQKAKDGEANQAIIEALAIYFGVKKNSVKLLVGEKNSHKIFEIFNENISRS